MNQVMGAYGYNIEQILMVDIIPDPSVRRAMNEINAGAYPFLLCSVKHISNIDILIFICKSNY